MWRGFTLALIIALHGLAFGLLLHLNAERRAWVEPQPVMVEFIPPARLEEPAPARPSTPRHASVVPTPAEPPAPKPSPNPPREPLPAPLMTTVAAAAAISTPRPQSMQQPAVAVATPVPVTPPEFNAAYLNNPPPAYPPQSRRRGEQGTVLLRVHIATTGLADQILIQDSSGSPRLDQAAQEAIRTWHFTPARQGDRPVPAWVAVPIRFKLGD